MLSLEKEEARSTIPPFLYEAIYEYRKAIRTDSSLLDCYSDQLNSTLNICEVDNWLSKEQVDRIRNRYFEDR